MRTIEKKDILREVGRYLLASLLSIVILIWLLQLWKVDLSIPFGYAGDELQVNMLIKGVIDNGWYLHNEFVGMPTGLDISDYPSSLADNVHFVVMKLISVIVPDYAITKNIFVLLTFPLTTASAMFVFRYFGLSYASSAVGGLLFAFLPYHFWRATGHTFLSAYYTVPFAILLALRIFAEKPIFSRFDAVKEKFRLEPLSGRAIGATAICFLIASGGAYYAFFACFSLSIAGIAALLTNKRRRKFLDAVILVAMISVFMLVNLSPTFYYAYKHGRNEEAVVRYPQEAEMVGLKIAQLLFPVDNHRVAALAKFKKCYNDTTPLINENTSAALGIVGSIGFLILLGNLLIPHRGSPDERSKLIGRLGVLNISSVLLGTIGGFSAVFSYVIDPTIRSYNRISIYIAFYALMAFFLFYESVAQRFKNTKALSVFFSALPWLILTIGILDQTQYRLDWNKTFEEKYRQDAKFIQEIEALMPKNAMIFQLPFAPFPEAGPVYDMSDYEHLKAYLHSKNLRWSYGAMKGRENVRWQGIVTAEPVDEFLENISLKGFSGIYLDRFGYPDRGAELEAKLSALLQREPLRSRDKRLLFFDMSAYRGKAIKVRSSVTELELDPAMKAIPSRRETDNIMYSLDLVATEGSLLRVTGWAFLKEKGAEGERIYVAFRSNKKAFMVETIPVYRRDVTQHFKPLNLDNSGFSAVVPKKFFDAGEEYRVGIYVKKGDIEGLRYTKKAILFP